MRVNPDLNNMAHNIIFSRKTKKIFHPSLRFNSIIVPQSSHQRHLGIFLEARVSFEEHLKVLTAKGHETTGNRKLDLVYKIFIENKPVYLFSLIPTKNLNYTIRNTDKITLFHNKQNYFKILFFNPLLLNQTS